MVLFFQDFARCGRCSGGLERAARAILRGAGLEHAALRSEFVDREPGPRPQRLGELRRDGSSFGSS